MKRAIPAVLLTMIVFLVAYAVPVYTRASNPVDSSGSCSDPAARTDTVNETVRLDSPGSGGNILQFKAGRHVLGFQPNKVYLAGLDHALSIEFLGTPGVTPTAVANAPTKVNTTRALTSNTVMYENLWNKVSLIYESTKGGITESTYRVAPGGDVSRIRLRYNVPVEQQKDGSLRFKFDSGYLSESSPVAWQEIKGKRVPVTVAFSVSGGEAGFTVGQYDRSYPLIIDPTYEWHAFYGLTNADEGYGIAVDGSGNVYVTGTSSRTWGSPLHAASGYNDLFVLKLDSSGVYQWHTFYGSSSIDMPKSIAVDGSGNVYVTGTSQATWGSPLHAFSGESDLFVLKLDGSGAYQWNTFYGSSGGTGIAVDRSGNVYVTGASTATWGSPLHAYNGGGGSNADIFVLKLDSSGAYQWNTFYGSTNRDFGYGIAVDGNGNVYVTGLSMATWGSPLNAYNGRSFVSGNIFVLKLDNSGAYQWHTFYGQSSAVDSAIAIGIAVDGSGNIYVTGTSEATWGSPLHAHSGYADAFVLKLNNSGAYQWHTFYGSGGIDIAKFIAVDRSGNAYVTGVAYETWGTPVNAFTGDSNSDIFVLKLNNSGAYQWHGFYGSSSTDYGMGIAIDGSGNAYVAGWSTATWGFPLQAYSGGILVLKLSDTAIPSLSSLTITKAGTGSGAVISSPSGIACGTTCSASYASGTSLTLTAVPTPNSCFIGWGTPCSGYGTCSLTLGSGTSLSATFQPTGTDFCDVTPGGWAEEYITTIFTHNVTTGCASGTTAQDRRYCPSDQVTRAQMAAFIVRAKEGEPPSTLCASGSPFTDVDQNDWSCKYIKRLKELNLTTGYGGDPTLYAPTLTVTREQMAAFIIRAKEGEPSATLCDSGSAFTDIPASSWSCKYVKRLKDLQLTTGYGGDPTVYAPSLLVARDQMAAFLGRAFYGMR